MPTPPPQYGFNFHQKRAFSVPGPHATCPITGRSFYHDQSHKRCGNYDGKRISSLQLTAAACFEYCEAVRGCGNCEMFSFSEQLHAPGGNCMFSSSSIMSCEVENWGQNGYSTYSATGYCTGVLSRS